MAHAGLKKAVIVGPAWVGDMVMSHALVQLLTAKYHEIYMVAPPATVPVAERMPGIRRVLAVDLPHGQLGLSKRWQMARLLKSLDFDAAYVLPNSWKSALFTAFANIPERIGWHGEARYGLLNRRLRDVSDYPLMIERFMALADPAGNLIDQPYPLPRLTVDEENQRNCLKRFDLDPVRVVALCPGAEFGAAKKWPVEHYAKLAQSLLEGGSQVWLLGSPGDAEDCARITELTPKVVNLAGKTSLLDAIDLLAVCSRVVCNDSGLMHVACALGVATIGIFGSTSPSFTPPLGEAAQVVELNMGCRPCFQRECPLKHRRCLNDLSPERVLDRIGS
ncbi:MAG: lipopolysaccharide heptosyltransferase II [Pseudomonadales bacterium]|nr:lipopolysaccharide heptosyltransferase II [Pseudomonadales bacterium]